jgi:hypothetical protein
MNGEANDVVDLNENKLIDMEEEVKVIHEFIRSLSFREMIKILSPRRRPLNDRMKDKMVSYIDLLQPGPPTSRKDNKNEARSI